MKYVNKKACVFIAMMGITLGSYGCGAQVEPENYETTESPVQEEQTASEEDVINYFNDLYNTLTDYLNSENVETVKYEVNHILAEMTGFIFYDDPILGISLKDISDTGKQKIGEIWQATVLLMEEKYPEFTADVSKGVTEAQVKGLELYNSGKESLSGALKDAIGTENYDAIWNKADELVESGKTKVKEWYQKYNEID